MERYDIVKLFVRYEEDVASKKPNGKKRPVLLLIDNRDTSGTTTCAKIIHVQRPTEYKIKRWKEAGLTTPSYIDFGFKFPVEKSILANAEKLGKLTEEDINTIKSQQLDTTAYRRQQKKRLVKQNTRQNNSFDLDEIDESYDSFETNKYVFRIDKNNKRTKHYKSWDKIPEYKDKFIEISDGEYDRNWMSYSGNKNLNHVAATWLNNIYGIPVKQSMYFFDKYNLNIMDTSPTKLDDLHDMIVDYYAANDDDTEESVEEDRPLRVCRSCLMGIEAHEGNQHAKTLYVDEDDEEESKCDWCEETGFDTLYEI